MGNKTFFKKAIKEEISYRDIFSDAFVKHTKEDSARIFIAGTPLTTPSRADMLAEWTKPYAFIRFFVIDLLAIVILYLMHYIFGDVMSLNMLFILISSIVPLTMMVMVWEMNIPRNISFTEVLKMILIGGALGCFFTMLLDNVLDELHILQDETLRTTFAGLVEEPAKLIPVYMILSRKDKKRPYILNGILIGFAVGTGFAIVESIGYSFYAFTGGIVSTTAKVMEGEAREAMIIPTGAYWGLNQALVRMFSGVVGHGVYTSLGGGALMLAKGKENLSPKHLFSPKFLIYFAAAIFLHTCNNVPIGENLFILNVIPLKSVLVLLPLGFLLWLPMLRKGVNQVARISMAENGSLTRAVNGGHGLEKNYEKPEPVIEYEEYMPQREELSWCLVGLSGSWKEREISLYKGRQMIVGRSPQKATLVLENSPKVSGAHCELYFDGEKLMVRDLGSMNGTYLDQDKLLPQAVTVMRENSILCLGDNTCSFRLVRKMRRVS